MNAAHHAGGQHWWQAIAARYGLAPPDASSDTRSTEISATRPNEVLESLLAHRSVRAYSDRPLPDDLLQTLVAAGQSASTSSHLQAWSVVSVEDPARKARLSKLRVGRDS